MKKNLIFLVVLAMIIGAFTKKSTAVNISGVFYVGTGQTYTTLNSMFTYINSNTLDGDVVIKLTSNITETASAYLSTNASVYTITVQPSETATLPVMVSGTIASNGLIKIGAPNVIFDGSVNGSGINLIIKNTSASYYGIQLLSGANNCTIKNCLVQGSDYNSSYGIYSTSGGISNLTITNDSINNCKYAINIVGTTSSINSNFTISKTRFGTLSNGTGKRVQNYGMYLSYINGLNIDSNTIIMWAHYASITPKAIFLSTSATNVNITRNIFLKVANSDGTNSNYYGAAAIEISTGNANSNIKIINNLINDVSGFGTTTWGTTTLNGIRILGTTGGVSIYHNTINMYGNCNQYYAAGSSQTYSSAIYIAAGATNLDIRNNILYNTTVGVPVTSKAYAIYSAAPSTAFVNINNNDYYVNSSNQGVLGYLPSADLASLAALKLATGQDAFSISANPLFTSNSNTMPLVGSPVIGAGTALITVPFDYLNNARNPTAPCIGAYELNLINNDLNVKSLFTLGQLPLQAGSPHYVTALIGNSGINTLTNVNVNLSVTGANIFSNTQTISSIVSGQVDTIVFTGFIPTNLGLNNIQVTIPADDNLANNELNYRQEVNSDMFAYADTSTLISGTGFNTSSGLLLTKYKINGTKQVFSTQAWIRGASTIGKEIYGVVLDNNGVLLDTSYHKIITSADTSTWVTFSFLHPSVTTTTNNNVYVGIAQVASAISYLPLGYQTENPARRYAYYKSNGLSTVSLVESGNTGRYMIGATIGDAITNDASVLQIVNPVTACNLNNQTVTIKIKNEGLQTILASQNALVAYYKVDNGTVVSQNVNVDIAPQDTIDFTFTTQANLVAPSANVNYNITSWVDLLNDPFKINDTTRKTVISYYLPTPPVFTTPISTPYALVANLTATSSDIIKWYNSATTGSLLQTGTIYTTPVLYNNITYYLSSLSSSGPCESQRIPMQIDLSGIPLNDAGIDTVIVPTTILTGGTTEAIKVKLRSYGSSNLTSAMIGWTVNGIQQIPYSWSGNISQGNTIEVTIANKLLDTPGIFAVKAWAFDPNGSTDNYAINDTANNSMSVNLVGNYTIGSGGYFASVDTVVNLLNTVGIGDNVVFNILPGTYETRLIINAITGSGFDKTVTFTSSTGDSTSTILHYTTSASAAFLIKLTGTSYLKFNKLTLSVAGGASYGRVVELAANSNHIEVSNCILIGIPRTSSTSNSYSIIYGGAAGLNYNTFKNNRFEGGYRCVEIAGVSGNNNKGNYISGNIFNDFYSSGSYLTYQDSISIIGNTYYNFCTSTAYTLYLSTVNNIVVMKNKIKIAGATTSSINYVIYVGSANASSGTGLVANNFVMQSVGTGIVYGIYNSGSKNIDYYHNSISITKGSATSGAAFYNTGTCVNNRILNNILVNLGSGYAYYASSTSGIDSSNYNCMFTNGSNLAYWSGAKTNLAALQTANNREGNSISVNPNFADSTFDLHISNTFLIEKGISISEITDDIDGQYRGLLPTIGADEFLATRALNLTLFLEGLYNGINMDPTFNETAEQWGPNIADKITVELHNAITPSIIEATFSNQTLSTNGICNITVPSNLSDAYFIVAKHRNSITVWSSLPMSFNSSIINYNFSNTANSAYGDNLKEVGTGVYALYVGDVNQDEVVDLSDLVDMDFDLTNGTVAYTIYDLNGDGVVDLSDLVTIDENLTNGVVAMFP